MLGVVVVPRNAVVTQKRKQRVAVLLEPLFALQGCIAGELRGVEKSEEPVYFG